MMRFQTMPTVDDGSAPLSDIIEHDNHQPNEFPAHFFSKKREKVGGLRSFAVALGFLLCIPFLLLSCSNDMEKVKFFDRQNLPSQTLTNALILRSERGVLQVEIKAPFIAKYDVPEPMTIYPQGVELSFFDNSGTKIDSSATSIKNVRQKNQKEAPTSVRLSALHATSWDEKGVMMARDSVVIIDFSSGDTIYLQDIVWNQNDGRIFSNNPVRAKNGQRVTLGDSFHSDESFTNLQIVNQRGVIVMNND